MKRERNERRTMKRGEKKDKDKERSRKKTK